MPPGPDGGCWSWGRDPKVVSSLWVVARALWGFTALFWGERLARLQPEPGRWLCRLRREQGSWRVGVERGMWKGTRLGVGTAGGVPKVVLAGTCTLLVWGRRGGSRPGHPPGVFSRIFPPVLKRCRAGGCWWCSAGWCWLGMEQPGWFRGTDGRKDRRAAALPQLRVSALRLPPCPGSIPRVLASSWPPSACSGEIKASPLSSAVPSPP